MTLQEARQVIDDRSADMQRKLEAAAVIADSRRAELSDLIRCLHVGGLAAETAATALYNRTGRPYSGLVSEFSIDPVEWGRYLTKQLELAEK